MVLVAGFQLPFPIQRSDVPVVDISSATPILGSIAEEGAGGHWLFGGGSSSLSDLTGTQALTLQAAAPTYAEAYATVEGTAGNALLTSWTDAAVQTACFVARRVTDGRMYTGTLKPSAAAQGGSALYLNDATDALVITTRGSSTGGTVDMTWPTGVDVGDWFFAAFAEDDANKKRYVFIGGPTPTEYAQTYDGAKLLSTEKYAIGNGWNTASAYYGDVDIAEFIFYPAVSKPFADLRGIYARSKTRLLKRGLTVA